MNRKRNYVGIGIALGAGLGTAFGAATHNMGVWVAIGTGIGLALGMALSPRNSGDNAAPPPQQ